MQEVSIIFANLQSHEQTRFSLRPGINFILADDNNVGKSTIFKVLTTIAQSPAVSGSKINRLIRMGTEQGYAAFSFGSERVVAWFQRGNTAGSAKLFFEHVHPDGETTRHLSCPKALLDALGIVLSANGDVLNFNDADSVQLISRNTAEADAIITQVMQDERVELIKRNLYQLSHDLVTDDKDIVARCEMAEKLIKDMSYVDTVDEFNEALPELEYLCQICDALSGINLDTPANVPMPDVETMRDMVQICTALEPLVQLADITATVLPDDVVLLGQVTGILCAIDWQTMRAPTVYSSDIDRLRQEYFVIKTLQSACQSVDNLQRSERNLVAQELELLRLQDELREVSRDVVCPVKGRVYYTDEECIPNNS